MDELEVLVSEGASNDEIIYLLEKIHHEQALLTSMVQAYGYVIVPLCFMVLMLWWFFKQFLYKY